MYKLVLKTISYGPGFWESFGYNPFGGDLRNYLLYDILQLLIFFSGLFAASMIIYGAYVLITSVGEPDNISKGQKIITNAVIGLVLVGIAWMIINFAIATTTGAL